MAEKIQIRQELMQKVANDFKKASSNVETINNDIKKSTKDLLSSWEGKSKKAFNQEYEVLNANIGEYSEVLLDMANAIENVLNAFVEQDELLSKSMD